MERRHLPKPSIAPVKGSVGPISTYAATEEGGAASVDSPLRRLVTPLRVLADPAKDLGDIKHERLSRLSLHEFCERIALLAELELPCSVYIANPSAEQISRGVVRKIERDSDRLNLFGDGFSLHLHQNNIDAIWLVNSTSNDDQGMAIEIHNRTGSLIARLFGIQDGIGAAVWQDVMGNPSFAVA